jgi:PilZ domain
MDSSDRRKHKRVALHWPVRISRKPGTRLINSTMQNLSSEGFYCITAEPFTIGERLQCAIVLPVEIVASGTTVGLQCHLTVRRVENLQEGFGLGCQIEDYSLLPESLQQRPM